MKRHNDQSQVDKKKAKRSTEDIVKMIESEEAEWREGTTNAEKAVAELFYSFKFARSNATFGHMLEDYTETLSKELQDVTPEEMNEAFENMIGNYMKLEQPK